MSNNEISALVGGENAIKGDNKEDTPAIIGGVFAGLVVLGCVVAGILVWRKKKNAKATLVIAARDEPKKHVYGQRQRGDKPHEPDLIQTPHT
jgi:hypothetical protein